MSLIKWKEGNNMQYEDFYALELEAEMREQEECWRTQEDELYLKLVEEWEHKHKDSDYMLDKKLRKSWKEVW